MDRIIIEFLQDIVSVLEDHLRPLVEAELSVLVDILYRPELLFPTGTDARRKCENGGFIRYHSQTFGNFGSFTKFLTFSRRLISHTSKLMEERQERLCIRILQTLRAMMAVDPEYGEKVRNRLNLDEISSLNLNLFSGRRSTYQLPYPVLRQVPAASDAMRTNHNSAR